MTFPDLLAHRRGRALVFAVLYFAEGAPIGFLWWALPALLRERGLAVGEITSMTAVLALPWALKFLWAPLVDGLRNDRWGLRGWIAAAQLTMGAALLPLLVLDWETSFALIFACLCVHAFAAATQDVAVDALAIQSVPEAERGSINGWMQAGMLGGRAVLGGFGLAIASFVGIAGLVAMLVAAIWAAMAMLLFVPAHASEVPGGRGRFRELGAGLAAAARSRVTWLGLAFAAVGGAGFEAVGAVAGPFLVDRGTSSGTIGLFFSVVSVPCMIAGALLGGRAADAWGKARATGVFLLAIFATVVLVAVVDAAGAGSVPKLAALASLYVALGLFTASSYALFMDLTDARIAATQFSAFMAMTNVCESWSAYAVGQAIPVLGYPLAFTTIGLLSLLGLPLLAPLGRRAARPG